MCIPLFLWPQRSCPPSSHVNYCTQCTSESWSEYFTKRVLPKTYKCTSTSIIWLCCDQHVQNKKTHHFRRNWTSSSSSSSHNDTTITSAEALKSLGGDDQWKRCWRNHDEDEIKVDFILENSKCNTSYKHLHWSMASSNRARCSQTPRLYPLANCLRRSNRIFPSIYRLHVLNQPVETSTAKPCWRCFFLAPAAGSIYPMK